MKSKNKIYRAVTVVMVVTVVLCAFYIMAKGLGLSDTLDFGAGAYFYADIPSMEKFTGDGLYHTEIPYWVYVLLFLAWGWLMFRLWVRLENCGRKNAAPDKKTGRPRRRAKGL